MSNASFPIVSGATIRPEEAAHFGQLAAEWWDPKGSSAMLHKLNPVRLGFIRAAIDTHWKTDTRSLKPLAEKRVLDVGCGAGLLCEPLARLGGAVTGVDAAAENIAAAQAHAAGSGLAIDYRHGEIGALGLADFDLVCSLGDSAIAPVRDFLKRSESASSWALRVLEARCVGPSVEIYRLR